MGLKRRIDLIKEFLQLLHTKYVTGFDAPATPLLDPVTLDWLTAELKLTNLYLEFGCGGTTLLANSLLVRTISVESDALYATVVRRALKQPEATEIVIPDMGITDAWGMPLFFARTKGGRYISAPFEAMCAEFPDLIFVDGRYRIACALESASRAFHARTTAKHTKSSGSGPPSQDPTPELSAPPSSRCFEDIGIAEANRLGRELT